MKMTKYFKECSTDVMCNKCNGIKSHDFFGKTRQRYRTELGTQIGHSMDLEVPIRSCDIDSSNEAVIIFIDIGPSYVNALMVMGFISVPKANTPASGNILVALFVLL